MFMWLLVKYSNHTSWTSKQWIMYVGQNEGDGGFDSMENKQENFENLHLKRGFLFFLCDSECVRSSVQSTRLTEQCVNGLTGWTRWGPADGFPHCRGAAMCHQKIEDKKSLRNINMAQRPAPAPSSSSPPIPLVCKWQLSPFGLSCHRLCHISSFSVH